MNDVLKKYFITLAVLHRSV